MARWWTNCSLVTGFSGPRVRAFRKQLNKSERNPCFPDSKVPPGMPGCCVPLCTNSFKKGYIMAQFPRDPSRRQIWASYVWRDDWTPTDASTICEVNFITVAIRIICLSLYEFFYSYRRTSPQRCGKEVVQMGNAN